jgi:hypothetical protein
MSCGGGWPNFDAWLGSAWGAGYELSAAFPFFGGSNFTPPGGNPPYYLDDFLAVCPKFFGAATALAGIGTTAGSNVVTVPPIAGLAPGQFLQAPGVLPKSGVITSVSLGSITVSQPAMVTQSDSVAMVYAQPPLPIAVIQLYLNLATASLQFNRWQEQWYLAMGWFIAHYCTLYAQTDDGAVVTALQTMIHGEAPAGAVPGTVYTLSSAPPSGGLQALVRNGLFQTPGVDYTLVGNLITLTLPTVTDDKLYATWPIQQAITSANNTLSASAIAAQGLANGILTSKSVGDASASYQALESLKDWGQWQLTRYGQLLATSARVMGAGGALIY